MVVFNVIKSYNICEFTVFFWTRRRGSFLQSTVYHTISHIITMSDRNQMLDPKLPTVGWVMAASIWQKHSNPIPSSFSSFYIYIHDFKYQQPHESQYVAQHVLHDSSGITRPPRLRDLRDLPGSQRFSQEMCLLYAEGDPATGAELGRTVVDPLYHVFVWGNTKGKLEAEETSIFVHQIPRGPVSIFPRSNWLNEFGNWNTRKEESKNDGDILKLEPVLVRIWGFSPPKKDMIYVPQWCMEFSYAKCW